MDTLTTTSSLLDAALEQYINVCFAFPSCISQTAWASGGRQVLSDRIANELYQLTRFAKKLQRARKALNRARNCFITINTLPDELLTRIFHLVLGSQPCTAGVDGFEGLLPMYPDLLSHVCSRWRQVAIGSRTLWSHIDLAPCHLLGKGLLARANTSAVRAGYSPLYIHAINLDVEVDFDDAKSEHEAFLDSVGKQMKTLELAMAGGGVLDPIESNIDNVDMLESYLGSCEPGTLTQLSIIDETFSSPSFLESAYSLAQESPENSTLIAFPHEFLEDLWHSVVVLRLQGLYPYWTSRAYHNLVELRLTSGGDPDIPISELQLVSIMTSSPRLRVFQFDLMITDSAPQGTPVTPVCLNDLQVLNLGSMGPQLVTCIRWLAPGLLPLQVSIADRFQRGAYLETPEIKEFFTRSNIVTLRLVDLWVTYQEIVELSGLLPRLRFLTIGSSTLEHEPSQLEASESHPNENKVLATSFRLDYLNLHSCDGNLDGLQWMIERNPVQQLRLWNCTFSHNGQIIHDNQTHIHRLSDICSVVSLTDGCGQNVFDDWVLFA